MGLASATACVNKVILASPVRQTPQVLTEFLQSLDAVSEVEFWLYDDNDDAKSRRIVRDFCAQPHRRLLPRETGLPVSYYARLGHTHYWTNDTLARVGRIKDAIIRTFLASDATALMLVDSDLLIEPELPAHLLGLGLPVVSEVFWTRWRPDLPLLPQVWDIHPGGFRGRESVTRLRSPGQYPVGGLGACTVIRREVLERGLRFAPIPGLSYTGEDRHFCVRAGVLGVPLFVDTVHPAFHVYRDDDLADVSAWRGDGRAWLDRQLDAEWDAQVVTWFRGIVAERASETAQYAGGTEPWVTDLLGAICRAIGAQRAVEVGVLKGYTTLALTRACGEVIGIDRIITTDAVNRLMGERNVTLIEGDGVQALAAVKGPFDFAYLDDGHAYAEVLAQAEVLWPKLAPGAIVAFHDAMSDNGVAQVLRERFPEAVLLRTTPFPFAGVTGLALVQKR